MLFIADIQYQILNLIENAHYQYAFMATNRKNWIGCKPWRTNNWMFYGIRLKPYLTELSKKEFQTYKIHVPFKDQITLDKDEQWGNDLELMTLVVANKLKPCIISIKVAYLTKWEDFLATLVNTKDIILIKSDNDISPNTKDFFDNVVLNKQIVIMNSIYYSYLSRIKLNGEINRIDYLPNDRREPSNSFISFDYYIQSNYRIGKLCDNIEPVVKYEKLNIISRDYELDSPISKYIGERLMQNKDKLKKLIIVTDNNIKLHNCKIYIRRNRINEEDVENSLHNTVIMCKSDDIMCIYPQNSSKLFSSKNNVLFDDIIIINRNRHMKELLEEVSFVSNIRRYISVTHIYTDINIIAAKYVSSELKFDMDVLYGLTYNMLRLLGIDMSKLSNDDMRLIFREFTYKQWNDSKNVKILTSEQASKLSF